MDFVTILLASAGRRPYLVEWFKDALRMNKVDGRVVVVDTDPYAASRGVSDRFIVAPPVIDEGYESWLAATLVDESIDLAISLNDFELSRWSQLDADFPRVDRLLRLDAETHRVVEDKILMAGVLLDHGVKSPSTRTATDVLANLEVYRHRDFVTKGRFGSASRGLRMATADQLPEMISSALRDVTDASGVSAPASDPRSLDLLVVQDRIYGDEYGLDLVSDLGCEHATVHARRKISMRGGETDRAISVDPAPFEELGRQISLAIPHRGSIDVDVLVDADGEAWLIDINPRLGGGYPFSHLAGAHTPAAYVAWLRRAAPEPGWLLSERGIVSSKYVGVSREI